MSVVKMKLPSLVVLILIVKYSLVNCFNLTSIDEVFQEFSERLNGESSNESNTDSLCLTQLLQISHGVASNEIWALKIIDAWSKLNSGLFSGNLANFGHFDQCIKVSHVMEESGTLQGQYCMTTFKEKEGNSNETGVGSPNM